MIMITRLTRSQMMATGCAAVLLGLGALSRTAGAFNPQPDPPGFGMVGIAEGQTARLNVVNLGNADPQSPPDPCRVELQFFDADGNPIAGSRVRVKPGQAASLDYVATFVPTNVVTDAVTPARAEIRPAVNTDTGLLAPQCRATVEIFDNSTGRTAVFIPPPCRSARCWAQP
jgi:hypothetical protein